MSLFFEIKLILSRHIENIYSLHDANRDKYKACVFDTRPYNGAPTSFSFDFNIG